MTRKDFEQQSLVRIVLGCYIFNLLLGWAGSTFPGASTGQLMLFQVGNAFAISGSVMAARYVGLRGQHVAASAFILLGITHGISLAAVNKEGIDAAREATMAMPMIPALVFMLWCTLFPVWLRLLGLVPSLFFAMIYLSVHREDAFLMRTLYLGYATLQVTEVLWGAYMYRDWKRLHQHSH